MRKRLLKYILMVFLVIFDFCGVSAQKPQTSISKDTLLYPDFKKCFDILTKNRITYNQYNDSVFLIKEHDAWVEFFRHRAVKNQQIVADNKDAIKTITDYFAQDECKINHDAYRALRVAFRSYLDQEVSDPFLIQRIGTVMDRHYEHCDSIGCNNDAFQLNVWLGTCYYNLALLGNDTAYVGKSYQYFKRNIQAEDEQRCTDKAALAYSLFNLLKPTYIYNKVEPLAEYYKYRGGLRELLAQDTMKVILSKKTYQTINSTLKAADETLLRNIYMTDSTVMDKHLADSLMENIIARNLANGRITPNTHIRTLLMQVKLGQLTAKEALYCALDRYEKLRDTLLVRRLNTNDFTAYIIPFSTFFYLNDMANISFAKKQRIVKHMCEDIITAYGQRRDTQSNNNYVRYLNMLTTYPRITKYLSSEERIRFLNALNVATQVTTYAHSVHVSMIAKTLMEGILKYQPTLLTGTLGCRHTADVVKNKKSFLTFIHDAAMYHDLGKNSIISVVNNDYRPLTDEEFTIIKRHPELGLQYLDLSPSLAKYHDTTLGHHKWYNGKGGYPDSFDNTKSDIRIMIDIVTLADCMQAATERVGRNYKGEKTFDTVMNEFRRDAGVKYNPDLVTFIDRHSDVAEKLAALVNEGWVEIYYNIYSEYMKR